MTNPGLLLEAGGMAGPGPLGLENCYETDGTA
jgi:hypothetical protein